MSEQKKLSPFDFLTSINDSKVDIMTDADNERLYSAYMVNRGLSYFNDTVLYANEMNLHAHLDNRLQYDFLRLGIKKRRRFSKWDKPEKSDDIDLLKRVYGYTTDKARQALTLLNEKQLAEIRRRNDLGGRRR